MCIPLARSACMQRHHTLQTAKRRTPLLGSIPSRRVTSRHAAVGAFCEEGPLFDCMSRLAQFIRPVSGASHQQKQHHRLITIANPIEERHPHSPSPIYSLDALNGAAFVCSQRKSPLNSSSVESPLPR